MGIDAGNYLEKARFVPRLASDLLELLEQTEGKTLLDLGCGDGELTLRLVDAGYDVIGADTNLDLLEIAQSHGIKTVLASGEELTFKDQFDIVFSNAALHWMKKADDVCKCVNQALKGRGYFLAEFGGAGNVSNIVTAIEKVVKSVSGASFNNPWFFPTRQEYARLLKENGFEILQIEVQKRPTPIGTNVCDWLSTFVSSNHLDTGTLSRSGFFKQVEQHLNQSEPTQSGQRIANYVRLRFLAQKTEN